MEIKINDYVRTKEGYICKIININDFREPSIKYGVEASYLKDVMFIGDEDIIKSSPRIIDLIDVGDYVNGYYVSTIWEAGEVTHYIDDKPIKRKERQITIQAPSYGGIVHLHNEDIKSVLTKEMFENISYKVGE